MHHSKHLLSLLNTKTNSMKEQIEKLIEKYEIMYQGHMDICKEAKRYGDKATLTTYEHAAWAGAFKYTITDLKQLLNQ